VRVRLHRARLFLRKQIVQPSDQDQNTAPAKPQKQRSVRAQHKPHPGLSCKQLFAKLSDYLEGELDPEMCEKFEKHFTGCKPCQAFLETLKATVEQTRKMPNPAANPELAAELRKKLTADLQRAIAAAQR
jgi:hypothetical protein